MVCARLGRVVLREPEYAPRRMKSSTRLKVNCELLLTWELMLTFTSLINDFRPAERNETWLEVLLTKSVVKADCNVFARFGEYSKLSLALTCQWRLKVWVVAKSTEFAVKSLYVWFCENQT